MGRIFTTIAKHMPLWSWFIIAMLATVPSYIFAREEMIDYEGYYIGRITSLTFNIILLFFIWGVASEKLFKNRSRKFSWIMFFIGVFILILIMKYIGGLPTIFG